MPLFLRHLGTPLALCFMQDDVIIWNRFPYYLTFVRGVHRSPVDSPHKETFEVFFFVPEYTVETMISYAMTLI